MIDTLRVRAALPYNVWMRLEKEKSFGVILTGTPYNKTSF